MPTQLAIKRSQRFWEPPSSTAGSEKFLAGGLEYRRGLAHYLDWTIGWVYEGSPGPINRYGITTQIWPTRTFFDDRVSLGVGLGVYFAIDNRREELGEGRPVIV